MKNRILYTLALLALCLSAVAQENYNIEKYLKSGAVPTVGGKVVFTDSVSIVDGYTAEQVNTLARAWVESFLKDRDAARNRVVKEENGRIDVMAQQEIVFANNAFSYDKALMNYVVTLNSAPDRCIISISRISYNYNDGTTTEVIIAEDYITDENAVNKKGTRLIPMTGKFRRKTIDAADEIFASFQEMVRPYAKESVAAAAKEAPIPLPAPKPVSAPVSEQVSAPVAEPAKVPEPQQNRLTQQAANLSGTLEGFRKIAPEELQGNIIKMISQDWMLITAGNAEKANMMTASWGGAGVLYNKPVAICFINPARYTYSIMEKSETFTLTFYPGEYKDVLQYCGTKSGRDEDKIKGSGLTPVYTENGAVAFSQACVIIECRKMLSQSLMLDSIENEQERNKRAMQPMHKMYIGEILNVWVKQ